MLCQPRIITCMLIVQRGVEPPGPALHQCLQVEKKKKTKKNFYFKTLNAKLKLKISQNINFSITKANNCDNSYYE